MASTTLSAHLTLLTTWRDRLRADLWGSVLPFWLENSIDPLGGFFNNLDADGAVFDTTKHVWLQGRQAWMLARVANTFTDAEVSHFFGAYASPARSARAAAGPAAPAPRTRAGLIAAARAGVEFLLKHAVAEDGSVYFALTREGVPLLAQRKPFSATFLIMALAEVSKAGGVPEYRVEAETLFDRVLGWAASPGGSGAALGKPGLPGAPNLSPLNEPMIFLNVATELAAAGPLADARTYRAPLRARCVEQIFSHVDMTRRAVFENVSPTGPDLSTPGGRLLCPGHAIEAGWFLLDEVCGSGCNPRDDALVSQALAVIDIAWESGWDGELGDGRVGAPARAAATAESDVGEGVGAGSGGFIYFRDALGFSPTQLEAHSKLWWPVAEAMIAFAKALAVTGDEKFLAAFDRVASWTYSHLVTDREWHGYADRSGVVTHKFKGGPCACLVASARVSFEKTTQLTPYSFPLHLQTRGASTSPAQCSFASARSPPSSSRSRREGLSLSQ